MTGMLLALLFTTCSGGEDKNEPVVVEVAAIKLSQTTLTLAVGDEAKLTATVTPDNATNKTVTWSSDNTVVATVSAQGTVTAVAEGSATITATAGGKSAKCTVTVQNSTIAVESITLSEETLSLTEGATFQLEATVMPENATDKTVIWNTSDGSVATVSEDGLVTAVAEGTATIIASAGGKSTQCEVTVTKEVIEVTGVTLSQTSLLLGEGATATLVATVEPENATDKTVTWSSSDETVVTVSDEGVVTGIKEGKAIVAATAGEQSAQCEVTVQKNVIEVTEITLSQTSLTLDEGATAKLIATVLPTDATDKTVIWNSSNPSVATVSDGLVTALQEGTAIITASAGKKSAQCTVTVQKGVVAVTEVTLSQTNLTLDEGESATLTATVLPADATDKTVTWSSSNPSVVSVSGGVVTAVREGTATITASAGGKTAQCTVTVNKKIIEVTEVTLSQTNLTLDEGESATLTATVLPADATDKTVTWSSSNPSVASVSDGVVTAVREGTATITASAGGKTAQCTVMVNKKIIEVTEVTLSQTNLTLDEGESATLTATVLPADATDKTVTWSSSNPSVASVSGGVVTAVREGTATITASAGGKTAQCTVTVNGESGMDADIDPWEDDGTDYGGKVN